MSTGAPLKSALKSQTKHAGNIGEVKTIAHASKLCLKFFDTCLVIAEDLGPKELALIQNQLGRLSLWISNIGVFALGRASIDARLQDVPDTHRLVKGLIEVLNGNLKKCLASLETWVNLVATASEASSKQIETVSSEFEVIVQRVANDISLLYQLSNTIRRAGRESQNSKATSLFEIKDAEGTNIEKFLEDRFLHNLTDKFPGCDEQLRQRLAATILLRRKRILYRRSRRPKAPVTGLRIMPEPEAGQISGTEGSITSVEVKQQETRPAETYTLNHEPSMVGSQARTTKTTTTLDPEKLQPPTAPSVFTVAKTIPLNSHEDLVFPPPPRAAILEQFREMKARRRARYKAHLQSIPAEDVLTMHSQILEAERDFKMGIDADFKACKNKETEVICPYCLCALSSTDMKSEGKWRDHLRGDLDAYVCLFQDCEKPYELYSHSDTWLKHMRQHAVRWQCMAKSHGPQIFERSEEYERHLREAHEGVFSESQILAMTERNARMMGPLFQSCPLCGVTKGHSTVTGRLEDHVVGHLRYLALVSLPYIEEEEQQTNSTDSLKSDDSAKPADRSTVNDLLEQEFDSTSEERQTVAESGPLNLHSDEDPYAAWNGIKHYVRASHTIIPGEPPKQILKIPSETFSSPWIPESRDSDESYLQQGDDSSRFVDAHDISHELSHTRSVQWGYIPMMMIPYEDQEADPILQQFRRSAVSNTVETEPTTSRGTSGSASGPHPVRQQILQRITSATITPTGFPSFVPIDMLTKLIDAETVSMALAEAGAYNMSGNNCAKVAEFLPRVFATLLLIGKVEAITQFRRRRFTDQILPLLCGSEPPDYTVWYSAIHPLDDKISGDIHPVSKCFRDPVLWTIDDFERFFESQWLFSAPVFYPEKFEYILAPQCPLPLNTLTPYREDEPPGRRVYTASIHTSHLSWKDTPGTDLLEVVVKIFDTEPNRREDIASGNIGSTADAIESAHVSKAFLDECEVLYAMRMIKHAHLLRAIAAFTRGDQCGFIMPRAKGSLRTFWETQDYAIFGPEKIIPWLFTQLLGITDGLDELHDNRRHGHGPSIRHGALTPDNILWFPGHKSDPDTHSLGVLVIGDTGRTRGLGKDTSGDLGAKRRYQARERPRSRADDFWSMGLIFFEFVIWLIRGNREVQEFRSQTSQVYLWDAGHDELERWSGLLMKDERCLPGTPLGELVDFIVGCLVVPGGPFATADQIHSWGSQVLSAVSASRSSYTAVQPNLPGLPRQRRHGRTSPPPPQIELELEPEK